MKKSICVILAVVLTTFMVSAQQYNHPRFTEGGTQHFDFSHPDSLEHGFNLPGDPTPHSRPNPNLKRKNTPSAPNEVIYRPTVVTVDDTSKFKFTYDSFGNLVTETIEYKNTPYNRYVYTYDSKGYNLAKISEEYVNGKWVPKWRNSYSYDHIGKMVSYLYENYGSGNYSAVRRETYSYNEKGKLVTTLGYEFSGSFVLTSRTTYKYDSNGNLVTKLGEYYSNGWVPSSRRTLVYDSNGNLVTWLFESNDSEKWVPKALYSYTYDANGNKLTEVFEENVNGVLTPKKRYYFTYDSSGLILAQKIDSYRDKNWIPDERYTFSYDSYGNLLTYIEEILSLGNWELYLKNTYIYDQNGNCSFAEAYFWLADTWKKEHGDFLKVFYNGGKNYFSFYGSTVIAEYKGFTLSTSDPNALPETITLNQNYPNPFNPATAITFSLPSESFTSLKVYNTLGEHVQTLVNGVLQSGVHNISFDATSLPSGVYVYRLEAGDVSISKKMMLMK